MAATSGPATLADFDARAIDGQEVDLASYDGQGHRLGGRTLSVAPTATVAWSPAPTSGYVLVTPLDTGAGAVRGAVSYAGDGLASVPLVVLPVREVRPHVEPGTG